MKIRTLEVDRWSRKFAYFPKTYVGDLKKVGNIKTCRQVTFWMEHYWTRYTYGMSKVFETHYMSEREYLNMWVNDLLCVYAPRLKDIYDTVALHDIATIWFNSEYQIRVENIPDRNSEDCAIHLNLFETIDLYVSKYLNTGMSPKEAIEAETGMTDADFRKAAFIRAVEHNEGQLLKNCVKTTATHVAEALLNDPYFKSAVINNSCELIRSLISRGNLLAEEITRRGMPTHTLLRYANGKEAVKEIRIEVEPKISEVTEC